MKEADRIHRVEKLKEFLMKDKAIHQAILFGSYAIKTQTVRSDMDVAIQLGEPMSSQQKLMYMQRIEECTGTVADIVDLHRVGQPLLSQIMKHGKRLKGSSTQYAELAIKNVNTSQDFLPFIQRIMEERRERLLNG